jgi:hypothetical protein
MIKAVVAGVSVSLILQVSAAKFMEVAYECCVSPGTATPIWYAAVSSPLGALVSLLPGFVAGWWARRRALLAGFLAGLLGNTIYSAILLTQWPAVIEGGTLDVAEVILRILILATSWGLGSAAAAGTAQLLRSNKTIEPTR